MNGNILKYEKADISHVADYPTDNIIERLIQVYVGGPMALCETGKAEVKRLSISTAHHKRTKRRDTDTHVS